MLKPKRKDTHIYIYIYNNNKYIYIYIHIYIEREREREMTNIHKYKYIYILPSKTAPQTHFGPGGKHNKEFECWSLPWPIFIFEEVGATTARPSVTPAKY